MAFDKNAVSDEAFGHKPVLLDECLDALNIRPNGIYLDGTLGRAGHSLEICRRLTTGRLICLDRDMTAIEAAKIRLADHMDRVTLVHTNFSEVGSVLKELGVAGVDGMLFDLVFPLRSWIRLNAVFPICMMRLWTCAWMHRPPLPPHRW